MKWEPTHIIKLVGLIIGFILALLGVFLLSKDIQALGSISIQTLFGSGKITSGSAGLFLLFFSFFVIIVSLLGRKINNNLERAFSSAFKVLVIMLFSLGLCILALMKAEGELRQGLGALAGFLGLVVFICVVCTLAAVEEDTKMIDKTK
ncbi:MAG: hypothetical protein P9X22_07275 [Candidatus Zapsychrus exili]|nr:hypothetical protein [Candidatus Zapsychrus exili]